MENHTKLIFGGIFLVAIAGIFSWLLRITLSPEKPATSFEECIQSGLPVMESYPRRCATPEGVSFVEDIGNELQKINLIRIDNPRPNQKIESPLTLQGQARGYWFFEASFPVKILKESGEEIGVAIAQAEGEWMTENFVPFKAILTFPAQPKGSKGKLVFQKDNPSGDPERDDALVMPITF